MLPPDPFHKVKILVVDDTELHRKISVAHLDAIFRSAIILTATTIPEAIKMAQENPPQIMVLDYHLGNQTCRPILETFKRDHRTFPIMIATGDRSEEVLEEVFLMGADDHINKPIDRDILESKVKSLLAARYISPLAFFGRESGLGPVNLKFKFELHSLTEERLQFRTPYLLGVGALLQVQIADLQFTVKVADNDRLPEEGYLGTAAILTDLLTLDQQAALRRTILHFGKQS